MLHDGEAIPKEIDLTEEELQELIQRLDENRLTDADRQLIKGVLTSHVWLSRKLEEEELSLKRLLRLLFRKRTESARNILKKVSAGDDKAEPTPGSVGSAELAGGHGRPPGSEYTGARRIHCAHPELAPGSHCPNAPAELSFVSETRECSSTSRRVLRSMQTYTKAIASDVAPVAPCSQPPFPRTFCP